MKQKRSLSSVKVAVIGNHSEKKYKSNCTIFGDTVLLTDFSEQLGWFSSELIRQWTIYVANTSLSDTLRILTNTIAGAAP